MYESNGPHIFQRLSAQVRARLLFQRELDIAAGAAVQCFSKETYEGVVRQRAKMEQQRSVFLRNVFFCIFAMILVSNGQDVQVPILNMNLASIPGLNPMLSVYAAITILFSTVYSINVGVYTGLMDQFAIKLTGNSVVDPDILNAAHAPHQLFIKIFSLRFNSYNDVHIQPGVLAHCFYLIAMILVTLLVSAIYGCMYAYVGYFALVHLEDNYVGIAAKVLTIFTMTVSVFLHAAANLSFKQTVYLEPVDPVGEPILQSEKNGTADEAPSS